MKPLKITLLLGFFLLSSLVSFAQLKIGHGAVWSAAHEDVGLSYNVGYGFHSKWEITLFSNLQLEENMSIDPLFSQREDIWDIHTVVKFYPISSFYLGLGLNFHRANVTLIEQSAVLNGFTSQQEVLTEQGLGITTLAGYEFYATKLVRPYLEIGWIDNRRGGYFSGSIGIRFHISLLSGE